MKKRLFAIIISLVFVCCVQETVFAAGTVIEYDGISVPFATCWDQAKEANGTLKLGVNYATKNNTGGFVVDGGKSMTLDLNGCTFTGYSGNADYLIKVAEGSTLTITDSSTGRNGAVSTVGYVEYDSTIIVEGGKLVLESGHLIGNNDEDCRLVYVENGTFTMTGGYVQNNVCNSDGAGVCVEDGTFTMAGGEISGNSAEDFWLLDPNGLGGGVYVDHGTMNMTGGKICNNSAYAGGNGIFLNESSLYLEGGEICNNTSANGGGIYYDGSSTSEFLMTGGLVHDNQGQIGAGIYIEDGEAHISGGKIYNNKIAIERTDALGEGVQIGPNADGVIIDGNVVITGNSTGVHATSPSDWAQDIAVTFGGSPQIYGNDMYDCYVTSDDCMAISNDIDTTPENHAWIGIGVYADHDFVMDSNNAISQSACFFGDDEDTVRVYRKVGTTITARLEAIDADDDQMTSMSLNKSKIVDKDGNELEEGKDYTVDFDEVFLVYTIIPADGVKIDMNCLNDNNILTTDRTGLVGIVRTGPQKTVGDDEKTAITAYYLCKTQIDDTRTTGTYYRNVYYTVSIPVETCKVSFDTPYSDPIDPQYVEVGERATEPPEPLRVAHSFAGWYTDRDCTDGNEYDFDSPVTKNITLYAKWEEGTPYPDYEVLFDANGHGEYTPGQIVHYGNSVLEPDPTPTAEGWNFRGWYREPECRNKYDFNTIVTENLTLYAKWASVEKQPPVFTPPTPKTGQVYTGNDLKIGHAGKTEDGTFYYCVTTSADTPADDAGWKTTIDKKKDVGTYYIHYYVKGDEDHLDSEKSYITSEILDAPDEGQFAVVFNMNGHGEQIPFIIVDDGKTVARPDDPSEDGFVFKGWYKDEELTTLWDFDTDTVTENIVLNAKWLSPWKFTPPEAITGLVTTGTAQELIVAGSVEDGGVMKYSISKDGPFDTAIPKGTDAGKYQVYFMIEEDAGHEAYICDTPIEVVIAKADPDDPDNPDPVVPDDPSDPDDPGNGNGGSSDDKNESSGASTGDDNNAVPYGVTMVLALAAIGVTLKKRTK